MGSLEQTKTGNLIIEGVLRLGQFTTANAPVGAEGALYFNTTDKKIKVRSDGVWGDLGGGASLWTASGTAASFDNDVYIGGGLYVQGQRVICPAGQGGTDSYCDYICTDYYVQTGTEGVETTEYCYNKTALLSANCGAVGGCKASDYTNCNSQSNSTLQYTCAICKYITSTDCYNNNVLGSCTNYNTTTYCAYNGINNGATNYHCSSGTCVCDSSTGTTSPDGKDNDCDGLVDETLCTSPVTGCSLAWSPCTTRCAVYNECTCVGNGQGYYQNQDVQSCPVASRVFTPCNQDLTRHASTCHCSPNTYN